MPPLMIPNRQATIPTLVRVKPGALDRLGLYLKRPGLSRAAVFVSFGFAPALLDRLRESLAGAGVDVVDERAVTSLEVAEARAQADSLPTGTEAVIGFGGGKALDVAKFVASLSGLPFFSVPASLSNDGFCSPQSSLMENGRRISLPSTMPFGVVIDTAVCLAAPRPLWLSGVGDLVSKITAVADWKLAFHADGTPVDDFAALLSDASVAQFRARPTRDLEGTKLLGTALLINGIAMAICGSSRPASGSEHLLSHALDALSARPRLHGLQVGVATYVMAQVQGMDPDIVGSLLDRTGFWDLLAEDPFSRAEWLEAARLAPTLKDRFYTILSSRDCVPEVAAILRNDPRLSRCFVD